VPFLDHLCDVSGEIPKDALVEWMHRWLLASRLIAPFAGVTASGKYAPPSTETTNAFCVLSYRARIVPAGATVVVAPGSLMSTSRFEVALGVVGVLATNEYPN
jgi:hypothetical protein